MMTSSFNLAIENLIFSSLHRAESTIACSPANCFNLAIENLIFSRKTSCVSGHPVPDKVSIS